MISCNNFDYYNKLTSSQHNSEFAELRSRNQKRHNKLIIVFDLHRDHSLSSLFHKTFNLERKKLKLSEVEENHDGRSLTIATSSED